MNFNVLRKFLKSPRNQYFQAFAVLIVCVIVNLYFSINENFLNAAFLNYSNIVNHLIILLIIITSFSIFLVSFYTYPQVRYFHIFISGSTFLTIFLTDSLQVFILPQIAQNYKNGEGHNAMILLCLLSRLIIGMGFLIYARAKAQPPKPYEKKKLVLSSLGIVVYVGFMLAMAASTSWLPSVFVESRGLTVTGLILAIAGLTLYIGVLISLFKQYRSSFDQLTGILACAFILMIFSNISVMNIRYKDDVWDMLFWFYQLASHILFMHVFYVDGIKKPYSLLYKAKEELNAYVSEMDKLVEKRTAELTAINKKLLADQEIARRMQLSMLPDVLPQNDAVTFSAGYLAAEKLSGDFYNVFKIDDMRFGIYVGDVSGHGVSAAMLSIFTFQKMQSLMEETGGEGMSIPSLVMNQLYDSFNAANFDDSMYEVMIYGVYNTDTGIFSYACAGLNTIPLRVRPDGSIQELDNDGFAICKLGEIYKPRYANHQIMLFPGDKLVLYTDGLVDARNENNEQYSVERLKNVILKNYKWGVDYLTKAVIQDVREFVGKDPADDVTLLIVDVLRPF